MKYLKLIMNISYKLKIMIETCVLASSLTLDHIGQLHLFVFSIFHS